MISASQVWHSIKYAFASNFEAKVNTYVLKFLKSNSFIVEYKNNTIRRTIIDIKSHKFEYAVLLLSIYILAGLLSYIMYPLDFGPKSPIGIDDYFRDFQTINLTLLGVQATLIGLRFPIVVALISILSDNRVGFTGRMGLFFHETEAKFVGVISLIFVIQISIQISMYSQFPDRVLATITALNIIWFIINVLLIVYFLIQTIKYNNNIQNFDMLKRYIANHVWPLELAEKVRMHTWYSSDLFSLDFMDSNLRPSVSTYSLANKGEELIQIDKPWSWYISDIRMRFIFCGLICGAIFNENKDRLAMTLPVVPMGNYRGKQTLLRYRGESKIGTLPRFLLRAGFVIRRAKVDGNVSDTKLVLSERVGDLVGLIDDGRSGEFSKLSRELVKLHSFLYHIAEGVESGSRINWAAAQDPIMGGGDWEWTGL